MRTLALALSLLGLFLDAAFGTDSIQLVNKDNHGGTVYQTVNINHNINVASFNMYSGMQSTNTIVDYNTGIITYHMPYKRLCVVSRMNRSTFPTISQLGDLVHEGHLAHPLHRSYGISRVLVTNTAQLGKPAEAICGGLNIYWANEYSRPRPAIGGRGCAEVKLLFLTVNLCGGLAL